MVGTHHSEVLQIPAKSARYGRWGYGQNDKTTGFSGKAAFSPNGGCKTPSANERSPL